MHEYYTIEAIVNMIVLKVSSSLCKGGKGRVENSLPPLAPTCKGEDVQYSQRVKTVTIAIGEQSGFADESVKMYFETLATAPIFKNTNLILKHETGKDVYLDHIEVAEGQI